LAMLVASWKYLSLWPSPLHVVVWFAGGACIGTGLSLPFKRPIMGASLGMLVQMFILLAKSPLLK
jgi:hypothetical protein